jgi:hypothetical protein
MAVAPSSSSFNSRLLALFRRPQLSLRCRRKCLAFMERPGAVLSAIFVVRFTTFAVSFTTLTFDSSLTPVACRESVVSLGCLSSFPKGCEGDELAPSLTLCVCAESANVLPAVTSGAYSVSSPRRAFSGPAASSAVFLFRDADPWPHSKPRRSRSALCVADNSPLSCKSFCDVIQQMRPL